jgi:site-specific DNA-methyltransferase (adenine-specific)
MFSFVGDVVLDPFWGIGNTTIGAIETHRSSIGFEIEPAFLEAGKRRVSNLSEDSTTEFITTQSE